MYTVWGCHTPNMNMWAALVWELRPFVGFFHYSTTEHNRFWPIKPIFEDQYCPYQSIPHMHISSISCQRVTDVNNRKRFFVTGLSFPSWVKMWEIWVTSKIGGFRKSDLLGENHQNRTYRAKNLQKYGI